ncbi:hypothetical protein RP20_CCG016777 [Aedes albopictus]|nr:hypothetical protein RP20_CCG016777 [Aedes albopictus]
MRSRGRGSCSFKLGKKLIEIATEVNFNEDLSPVQGLVVRKSAIDCRSAVPAATSGVKVLQYYRNAFSSLTPPTSHSSSSKR